MEYEKTTFEGKEVEIHRNFHPDGSLNSEWTQTTYELHGYQRKFYPSGKLKEEQFYRDGRKTAHDVSFYENGNKKTETVLLNKDEFKKSSYFENGQIKNEIVTNAEGKTLYYNKSWYQNGQLASTHQYTSLGEPTGKFFHYFEDGKIQIEGEYINGEANYINVFLTPTNQTIIQGEGILHTNFGGRLANLKSECKVSKGVRNGVAKTYKDGVLKSEVFYVAGKAEGKSIEYTPEGLIDQFVYFENGIFTKREKVN